MSVYHHFRDTALWFRPHREPEYPGEKVPGDSETVPVAYWGVKLKPVGGDMVHRRVWWTMPEHAVETKHRMDGHRVMEVEEFVRHGATVLWVVYGAV